MALAFYEGAKTRYKVCFDSLAGLVGSGLGSETKECDDWMHMNRRRVAVDLAASKLKVDEVELARHRSESNEESGYLHLGNRYGGCVEQRGCLVCIVL